MKAKSTAKKDLNYYLNLSWSLLFIQDFEDGGFAVKVEELPGCISQGDNIQEAHAMIQEALKLWLEVALKHGDPIPEPSQNDFSGKFMVRLPRSVHKELANKAKKEDVSLNLFVATTLAQVVGLPERTQKSKSRSRTASTVTN